MVILVDQKVQKILMPIEAIQQQRGSGSVMETGHLTTALEDEALVKISHQMKTLYWTQN